MLWKNDENTYGLIGEKVFFKMFTRLFLMSCESELEVLKSARMKTDSDFVASVPAFR